MEPNDVGSEFYLSLMDQFGPTDFYYMVKLPNTSPADIHMVDTPLLFGDQGNFQ